MEAVKEQTRLERYPAYKDSGVEWLGEIPEHWEVKKIKFLADVYNGDSLNEASKKKYESENLGFLAYISSKDIDVNDSSINYRNGLRIPFAERNLKLAPKNSPLLCIEGGSAGRKIAFTNEDVYFVNKLACFRNKGDNFSKYLFFSLKGSPFQSQFKLSISGLIGGVAISSINNFQLAIPPIQEQTAIANFLDEKCGKIDTAIAQKQELIELLKERKQIIIQNAVTGSTPLTHRGSTPLTHQHSDRSLRSLSGAEGKMKDSGVEWIGEIPEHWEVKKIKHVTSKIGSGVTPSGGGTTYLEEGIPLLRSQNIHFGFIDLEDSAKISLKIHNSMANSHVKKGDVLLNITGGSIGRCHYVETDLPLNVNQHVCIVRPKKEILPSFLNSLLASEIGQGQIWFYQQGGGREGLNFQALKNFSIPYPPIDEQENILAFLREELKIVDNAISLQETQIQKLKEYKSSLIDAAVTGKIRVLDNNYIQ